MDDFDPLCPKAMASSRSSTPSSWLPFHRGEINYSPLSKSPGSKKPCHLLFEALHRLLIAPKILTLIFLIILGWLLVAWISTPIINVACPGDLVNSSHDPSSIDSWFPSGVYGDNETGWPFQIIPNIVHYVLLEDHELKLVHFISILSVLR